MVALDPRTGEILAFWSFPSYDPNLLVGHDTKAVRRGCESCSTPTPTKPLLAQQYQERYFPGSTFKVVTGSTGLRDRHGHARRARLPGGDAATRRRRPTGRISNFGGEACGGTLFEILRVSCNTAFAQMGAETSAPTR